MKAIALKYEFKTFKHMFKQLNTNMYSVGYAHPIHGLQSFNLLINKKTGSETLDISGPDAWDSNRLITLTASRIHHINELSGAVGQNPHRFHWLEFAVRTGKFTYIKEQRRDMKERITSLLSDFVPNFKRINLGDRMVLYYHPDLECDGCKGNKPKTHPAYPTNKPEAIYDDTCIVCNGTYLNPNVDIESINGWRNFNDKQ